MDILSQVVPFLCIIILLTPLSLTIGSMTQEYKNDQALLQYAFFNSTEANLL
jgi:hypothetical protein